MAKKSAVPSALMNRLSKDEIEADAVAGLLDDGVSPVGLELKVAALLSGIPSPDILRAIHRGQIDARWKDGRIIVLYGSLRRYVLTLPALEARR